MVRTATRMANEAVNAAFEMPLRGGLLPERRMFHSLFATPEQTEGMSDFLEKRPAAFHEA